MSALEINFNVMRYINLSFTYLLTKSVLAANAHYKQSNKLVHKPIIRTISTVDICGLLITVIWP